MRIEYTGRQMEIGSDLRAYTEQHLRKINRLLGDRCGLHVILAAEKHRRTAEITLQFRDHALVGVEVTGDARSAIKGALDKLERQAVRFLERRRTQKRRPKPATAVVLTAFGAGRVDHDEHRVLQTEHVAIKPMTVEEAIDTLDAGSAGVVVFRNPQTERVNVIYQRPDGNLGLIEPEP